MENTNTLDEVTQLSIEQIIDETVEHYKSNPRGKYGHSCVYKNLDGAMCAVGRCLKDETLTDVFLTKYNEGYGAENLDGALGLDKILKPQYVGHPTNFWEHLQSLHDSDLNWTKTDAGNEITAYGKLAIDNMKTRNKNVWNKK